MDKIYNTIADLRTNLTKVYMLYNGDRIEIDTVEKGVSNCFLKDDDGLNYPMSDNEDDYFFQFDDKPVFGPKN